MHLRRWLTFLFVVGLAISANAAQPTYSHDEAVALAVAQNPEIVIARKRLEAARGSVIEARSGYLPSVVSTGIYRKREQQNSSRLRSDDYNAAVRIVQNIYTGGAVSNATAIARLNYEKQALELQTIIDRVTMDTRTAYYELLLNRAKVNVQEQSLNVFRQELKTQSERLSAGTVGELNVRRAEVSVANAEPDLIDAQSQLRLSYLRLAELFGVDTSATPDGVPFEIEGQLQYEQRRPDLNESLARAVLNRPEVKMRQLDVAIEEHQLKLDRSELRPQVQAFTGYEVYNERDPNLGREFNHGYVVGVNATWHLFDGFATKGRMIATRARREAAQAALEATENSIRTDVRSAFLDLQQSDRTLQSETKNVQNADESLEMAKSNLGVGLGTQLDVLQAASDVNRIRTTRLNAIYLHNVGLARLDRACGNDPATFAFQQKVLSVTEPHRKAGEKQMLEIARPPSTLNERK